MFATMFAATIILGQIEMPSDVKFPQPTKKIRSKLQLATQRAYKDTALLMIIYCLDNDGVYPKVKSTSSAIKALHPYIKQVDKSRLKNIKTRGGKVEFNLNLSGVSEYAVVYPAMTPMFYDSQEWPDGTRCVAFTDGQTIFVDKSEWKKIIPYLLRKYK
jgi:hypothetical protein